MNIGSVENCLINPRNSFTLQVDEFNAISWSDQAGRYAVKPIANKSAPKYMSAY